MKFEGDVAFTIGPEEIRFCTRPDLDCVWCLTREELEISQTIGGGKISDIPEFNDQICNCDADFAPAVDGAKRVGCDRLF